MRAGIVGLPPLLLGFLLLWLGGCASLQPRTELPEDLQPLAARVTAGDSNAAQTLLDELLDRIRLHERNGELYQATQLAVTGMKLLPDNSTLADLHRDMEAQLATARLLLSWEALIGETRQQLTEQELLRTESKLQSASSYRQWRLQRLNQSIMANADQLRDCARQSLANKLWHYAEDCIALAAQIRGEQFVSAERAQLAERNNGSRTTPKSTNILQERRLVSAFWHALNQSELLKARALLQRLSGMDLTTTNLAELQPYLDDAIAHKVSKLTETAAEHYRNQQYQQARGNWQEVLALDPDHAEATERLKRVDKVLQSLEELQSGADKP